VVYGVAEEVLAALRALAVVESRGATIGNQAAQWRSITRMLDEHDRTDARWLEYELDAANLLDFPVMIDMRDPLTTRFQKAKLRAGFHRPLRAEDLLDDRDAARQYFDAVENYVSAFNAEAEAIRRRRSDFSRDGQQRLARAQSLLRVASDTAATPQEREHAYALARTELDGLIVLPRKHPSQHRARNRRRDRRVGRPTAPDVRIFSGFGDQSVGLRRY
jgi:hypothetical protein